MEERAGQILQYWFGDGDDPFAAPRDRAALWFSARDATDAELRERFGDDHARSVRGEVDGWAASPRGRLALVILLDQLSRNLSRGTAGAFANDPKALALSLEGIERGDDRALRPIERVFLYMPLMHAEDRAVHVRSVALFTALAAEAPEAHRATFDNFTDFARKHAVIVERFGHYPHRNVILGRTSTREEIEFLKQPGSSF